MATERLQHTADLHPATMGESPERRIAAHYELELSKHRCREAQLRSALAERELLLRQKDELIRQQDILSKESGHRLRNDLQMIAGLLRLQSRASSAETASQLVVAANRVATVGQVHRHLHCLDGAETVAFKQYIEELCREFSTMLSSGERPEQVFLVEGIEIELPTATAIPLAFIVNELVTNAAKHGKGRITVRLEPHSERGYALSVCNDGPALPEGFDPAGGKGLGMKIILSLIGRIGGELRIGRNDDNEGARFVVLFA